jgi:hypothetical protein
MRAIACCAFVCLLMIASHGAQNMILFRDTSADHAFLEFVDCSLCLPPRPYLKVVIIQKGTPDRRLHIVYGHNLSVDYQ